MDAITLAREELYDQVWTTPARAVAARFGISNTELAQICEKHCIPRPPQGHWTRIRNGATIQRAPLPILGDDALRTVVIQPHRPLGPEQLQPPGVVVPEALANPHPLVYRTLGALRRAKPDDQGILQPRSRSALDVSVSREAMNRAMRILDALIKALEEHGATVSSTGEGSLKTAAGIHGTFVYFSLKEEVLRRSPSGRLALAFEHDSGASQRWIDGKDQRVEDCLSRFVEGVLRCAEPFREKWRAEQGRWKKRHEWEQERTEKLRLIREEEQLLKRLYAEADSFDRCRRLRAYIRHFVRTAEAAEGMRAQPGSSLLKWADWATLQADRLDPALKRPHSILDEKEEWERAHWSG